MLSLVMVLYGLPALMELWPGKLPQEGEFDRPGWRAFGTLLTVRPGWQSLALIAVSIGFSVGLYRFRTETRVIRYFPDRSQIAQDYWYIEANLAGAMPIETVIRFDEQSQKDTNFLDRMELVRQIQEQMRAHSEISGSASLASLQPVSEHPPESAGFLQKSRYNKHSMNVQQRIRDGEVPGVRSFYTIAEHGYQSDVSSNDHPHEAGDELWRITAQVNVMNDNDFSGILSDIHRIAQDILRMQPGSKHSIAGTVPIIARTQQALLQSLIGSFGLAFALIFAVLVMMLRSVWAGMVAMIPNILPITVVFGIISWTQQRIDIGSIITASIALGIAVGGTLHYLTQVRLLMMHGRTRRDAVIEGLVCCGPAMWQASVAVAIGLLVLIPAELMLVGRFGWLMASMIGASFVGNAVLLPQLLSSRLGWFFEPLKRVVEAPSIAAEPVNSQIEVPDRGSHGAQPPSPHIKSLEGTRKKRRPTA